MPPPGHFPDETVAIQKLVEEQESYGDIVQVRSPDTYGGLTQKTIETIRWAHRAYNPKFLMKCDDDSLVNIPLLYEELFNSTGAPTEDSAPLYWGWFHSKPEVRSDLSDKNHDTYTDAAGYWPTYASGSGYILSRKVVAFLDGFLSGSIMPRIYRNEDASLGLWLQGLELSRRNDNRFNLPKCQPGLIVHHPTTPDEMRRLFPFIKLHSCPPKPTTVFPAPHICLLWMCPTSVLLILLYHAWGAYRMHPRTPVKLV
jgi:hypothetical protein